MNRLASLFFILILTLGCSSEPVQEIQVTNSGNRNATPLPDSLAQNWPWWRGFYENGHMPGSEAPKEWTTSEGIRWQEKLPGSGHSSPVLWQDRLYLTTAIEDSEKKELLAFDRTTGKQQWQTTLHEGGWLGIHSKNTQASATPAIDGSRIYCAFMVTQNDSSGIWVSAVDFEGNLLWQERAGPFVSQHGYGSSPILYQDLIIILGDNASNGFLAALSRETGEIIWRIKRPRMNNYSTPLVAKIAGRDQLIVHGAEQVISYNPNNGKEIWRYQGVAPTCANTPVYDEDHVYVSGGYPKKEVTCIRADGEGDVTETHLVWKGRKSVAYVPSMLIDEDRLYSISDNGIAICYDSATGNIHWQERLAGATTASPILVGEQIYFCDEKGSTYIVKASDEYELIAENFLDEAIFATPVAFEGMLYLRTESSLFCLGPPR
ncbi:Outer membrane biogenesis protein BamB [Planctomycetales bacterium 10988]|nr:Outer membrane biogenesis protein BamB [Planctomycetales bacterium 10988]